MSKSWVFSKAMEGTFCQRLAYNYSFVSCWAVLVFQLCVVAWNYSKGHFPSTVFLVDLVGTSKKEKIANRV